MNDYESADGPGRVLLPLECLCVLSFPELGFYCPNRLPPGQLKAQVLKPGPLLPCEEDGVGMFRVFLARNSDGEFTVGHNTRENHIFLYINK